jgi:hypothetical protein
MSSESQCELLRGSKNFARGCSCSSADLFRGFAFFKRLGVWRTAAVVWFERSEKVTSTCIKRLARKENSPDILRV